MIDPQLASKVALSTGANHGIGAATAQALADQGARVFLTYYREPCDFTPEEMLVAKESGRGGVLLYRANQQQAADDIGFSPGL